jgi:hypothetical protein
VEGEQLDDGIGDTFVSVGATTPVKLWFAISASDSATNCSRNMQAGFEMTDFWHSAPDLCLPWRKGATLGSAKPTAKRCRSNHIEPI